MRFYHPYIFFLDDDLEKSAQAFTNEYLDLMIKHVNQILWCGLFYFVGVRSKRFHQYYFAKERKNESIMKWFPSMPGRKVPAMVGYNSVESRWVRKCANHFQYLSDYLNCLLEEYSYRHGKDHELYDFGDFHSRILINLSLTCGITIPSVNMKKVIIPWKNLAPMFRKRNIVEGYRKYYMTQIGNVYGAYGDVKRDIPEWMYGKNGLEEGEIDLCIDGKY